MPASRLGACLSKGLHAYTMNLTGLDGAAKQTAQTIYHAARVCDSATLVKVASSDKTRLGYDHTSAKSVFTIPQQGARYDTMLQLMGLPSVTASVNGSTTHIWPRAVGAPKDAAAWDEVVKLGLVTRAQATRMRENGNYTGPQLWIADDGTWKAYTP